MSEVQDQAAGPSDEVLASLERGGDEAALRLLLERLPGDHRGVLRLVREEGLSFAEAGRRMDRSENAAVKLYTRALCQLTKLVRGAGA